MPVKGPIEAISPSVLGSAWRFRRIVVICLLAGVLGAYLFTALSTPEYAAVAGVALAPPPASVTTAGAATIDVSPAEYQQQQIALIDSTSVAQAAARTVRTRMPSSDLTATALKAATSVQGPSTGSGGSTAATSTVTVTLPNPKEAAEAADAVVAAYIEAFHKQIALEVAESEAELDAQIKTITKQLKDLTPAERTQSGTTSPSSTTTTTSPKTSAAISPLSFGGATVDATTTTTTSSSSTTTTSSSTTTTTSSTTTTTTSTTTTTTTSTTTTTTTTVPATTTTTSVPATTTTSVPATTTTSVPATTTTTTAPSVSAEAQRTALTSTLAALTRDKSEILVNRAIDLEYDPAYVPAAVPTAPTANDTVLDLLIGALAGLVLGFVFAFLLASSRRRFDNPRQPSYVYGARLLATVPAFVVEEWTEVALPLVTDPTGEAAEGYRTLATALRAFRATSASLIVAVTACDLNAGATTVTANVGCALAEMGEKTVVLDTDTLGRSVSRALLPVSERAGLPEVQPGLSDLIDGRPLDETVLPSALVHGLWVVPSGRDATMAMHRWKADRMRAVLEEMAAQFDMVLIDTPPVGMTSYALDVVATAGQAVLVVPHHDSVRLHEKVAERLQVANAELVGYVYNGNPLDLDFSPYYPVVPTRAHSPRPPGSPSSAGPRVDAYGEDEHAQVPPESGGTVLAPPLDEPTGETTPSGSSRPPPWPEGGTATFDDTTVLPPGGSAGEGEVAGGPVAGGPVARGQRVFGPQSRLPWRRRAGGDEEQTQGPAEHDG